MNWIVSHWELIGTIVTFLILLLNAATKFFSAYTGVAKVLLVIVEVLSFLKSKDVDGLFKFPFTIKPPNDKIDERIKKLKIPLSAFLFILPVLSCGTWQQSVKTSLDITGATASEMRIAVSDHYKIKCEKLAHDCASNDSACDKYKKCSEDRADVYTVLKAAHMLRVAGYSALLIEDEESAKTNMEKAGKLLIDLYQTLKAGGVL